MKRINVTESYLPPLPQYVKYLEGIWSRVYLTNQGPLLREFEQKMEKYLNLHNFHFVTNGTIALQVALRSLGVDGGEVITTPFSYVATSSAILWERCTPIFVDIDPQTLCIDTNKIEAAITNKTKAIMPVHVFGNPCEVEHIDALAKQYNLKVIYDAAHAFGVTYKGKSLLDYGDISVCSFHATKLFHTVEGGCLVVSDEAVSKRVELMKRFGHEGDDHRMLGINAKASEFQAAMGLCNLESIDEIIKKRRRVASHYDDLLKYGSVQIVKINPDATANYAYYPVVFDTEEDLLRVKDRLAALSIFPRRYFHPSLNTLKYINSRQRCLVSEDISKRILCLPLFGDLPLKKVEEIVEVIVS